MNKIIKYILIIIGILLLLNSIVLAIIVNFNLGIIVTFIFGLFSFLWGLYYKQIKIASSKGILKWIKYAVFLGISYMIVVVLFLGIFGQIDNRSGNEEAIIILGAGIHGETPTRPLRERLDAGLKYWKENPKSILVVSGGMGTQEDISEALAMERYLLKKGVPQDVIYKEENSTSTFENFKYSKKLLDEHFNKPYRIVFVTNDFHIYRASVLAKNAKLDYGYLHASTDWYSLPMVYLREFLAVLKLWVFG